MTQNYNQRPKHFKNFLFVEISGPPFHLAAVMDPASTYNCSGIIFIKEALENFFLQLITFHILHFIHHHMQKTLTDYLNFYSLVNRLVSQWIKMEARIELEKTFSSHRGSWLCDAFSQSLVNNLHSLISSEMLWFL